MTAPMSTTALWLARAGPCSISSGSAVHSADRGGGPPGPAIVGTGEGYGCALPAAGDAAVAPVGIAAQRAGRGARGRDDRDGGRLRVRTRPGARSPLIARGRRA